MISVRSDNVHWRKIGVCTDGMSSGVYIYTLRSGLGFYTGKDCVLR